MDNATSAIDQVEANVPVSFYVLKVASRCNLNCKYCYMYNLGDLSYQGQPKVMSDAVITAMVTKIKLHSAKHNLRSVVMVFHGGEPMLAGMVFFRKLVDEAKRNLLPEVTPRFCMQTNGTLLTPEWINLLSELEIGFGISLDGPPELNDQNRIDHAGQGSYQTVRNAIEMTLSHERGKELFGSVLTVVNLESDPITTYTHFKGMGLRGVDFLLPEGTYDAPPPGLELRVSGTPYADWLIPIFDRWFEESDPSFRIRFFENIVALIFGSLHSTDNIGGRENHVLVIETDGGIEPVDVLKSCGHEFTKLGLNVLTHEIDDVYQSSLIRTYQAGARALCATCRSCPIVDVCGGGYIPHRFRATNAFNNPSVYCRDLSKLITHIQAKVLQTIPPHTRQRLGLAPMMDEEVRAILESVRLDAREEASIAGVNPAVVRLPMLQVR